MKGGGSEKVTEARRWVGGGILTDSRKPSDLRLGQERSTHGESGACRPASHTSWGESREWSGFGEGDLSGNTLRAVRGRGPDPRSLSRCWREEQW